MLISYHWQITTRDPADCENSGLIYQAQKSYTLFQKLTNGNPVIFLSCEKKIATVKAQLHCEMHQYRRLPNQVGQKGEGALTRIKCITIITADSLTLL